MLMNADKLGYFYADEDSIDRAAVELNVSPDLEKIIEMEPGGSLRRYLYKATPFEKSFMERPLNDKQTHIDGFKYIELVKTIIIPVAKEGNAVIVGRGGQFILEDFDDTYHLLLIADEKDRIQFMADNYNLSHKKAVQSVKRMEKRRVNLYSYFGRKDYDDLANYHLVLNLSKLSMDKAEELVYELVN
jgi:hypothetical protein